MCNCRTMLRRHALIRDLAKVIYARYFIHEMNQTVINTDAWPASQLSIPSFSTFAHHVRALPDALHCWQAFKVGSLLV